MEMTKSQELLFELLLVSTRARKSLLHSYSENVWRDALLLAREQAIIGVLVTALEELRKYNPDSQPSKMLLIEWLGMGNIEEQNTAKLNEAGETVVKYFRENGFACQILKGSSVGRYYPYPLRRTSGDIDVWLDGGRKKIYDFARKFDEKGELHGVNYHHIHFHLIEGVHIEAHIWPSFLSSPLRNYRLHQFCNLYRPTMDNDRTSLAFDRVFIMLHCYRHICGHGVGLRQIMDYFYVLKRSFDNNDYLRSATTGDACQSKNPNDNWREETVKWIKKLGMERFARGLMWVLQVYFGLESQYLLMKPDEKEGRFIIEEVLQTGNMGHSETRNWGSTKTPLSRFFHNLRRDAYLAKHYPHEALWQPFFSLWLYGWRFSKGLMKNREKH